MNWPPAKPGSGVNAAGVNFWEIMQREGRVPAPPRGVPGSEGAGVVVEVADGVDTLTPGQRVAWSRVPGSYGEEVVAAATDFLPIVDALDDESAASLLFQGVTAQYLATDAWPLDAGDVAVVTAASGGVGVLLTQLLVHRGVRVLGVTSSEAKQATALEAGAETVLSYDDNLADQVRELVPDGVAAVYDAVGGSWPRVLLPTLRARGAMVLYGSASGTESDLGARDLGAGSWYLTRTAGRDYARTPAEAQGRAAVVLDLGAQGALRPHIGGRYPLADAGAALNDMAGRSTTGKLLIVP